MRLARIPALLAVLAAALTLTFAPAPAEARPGNACANKLCTKLKPKAVNCHDRGSRRAVARCFIARAATHYRQNRTLAFSIAHRESRFDWRVTNRSSGAAGLFQFMPVTWNHTPYRRHSPYSPKWASLAAMWMWSRGGFSHWHVR